MENQIIDDKTVMNQNSSQDSNNQIKAKKKFDWVEFGRNHLFELIALGAFIFLLILFSFLPQVMTGRSFARVGFWRPSNLRSYVDRVMIYMILAIGATFVYSMGTMDISVGYQVGIMATVFILVANATGSLILGIIVSLLIGVLSAIFNAFVGAYVKLPTVMSSVILMQFFRGLLTRYFEDDKSRDQKAIILDKQFNIDWATSTSFRVVSLIILAAIGVYVLGYTKLGKRARAIGANKRAADLAGAQFLKTRLIAYIVFGGFLVVSAFMLVSNSNGYDGASSANYQMDIMIMLLMGGMPLSGGMKTKLTNAILGTLTYALLSNGFILCGVSANYIFFVNALIFITIVVLTCRKTGEVLPR